MWSDQLIAAQRGPILVTFAFLLLYYIFLVAQSCTKFLLHSKGAVKRGDGTGKPASFKYVKYESKGK
jgi:hypothetical protein